MGDTADEELNDIDAIADILDILERVNINFNYFDWFAE